MGMTRAVWVGQERVWVGHGLPGLIARTASAHTTQENDFELILTVKMETKHPIEGYFGSEFRAICNHWGVMAAWSRKTWKFDEFLRFLEKRPFTSKIVKILFRKFHRVTDQRCCVQSSWNVADDKWAKSCGIYETKQAKFYLPVKLSLLRGSRPKSARANSQQCTQSASDFIQISSLSAEL